MEMKDHSLQPKNGKSGDLLEKMIKIQVSSRK